MADAEAGDWESRFLSDLGIKYANPVAYRQNIDMGIYCVDDIGHSHVYGEREGHL